MLEIREYNDSFQIELFEFLKDCLPESGRCFEPDSKHRFYRNINDSFLLFLCLFDGDSLIGTVAVRALNSSDCELKSLYLYEKYHGRGLGLRLLQRAVEYAKDAGFERMYLDSITATSSRAISLYRKFGFMETERYNDSEKCDIFMLLELI